MSKLTRRGFIQTSAVAATVAASGVHKRGLRSASAAPADNILLMVYLTGGVDSLNLVVPTSGADRSHYEAARHSLNIAADAALPLGASAFGLHPNAPELHALFGQTNSPFAIVQAAGSPAHTRSHTEASAYMFNGTPGDMSTATGWITRHLDSDPNMPTSVLMPGASLDELPSPAFNGSNDILTAERSSYFQSNLMLNGFSLHRNEQRRAMRALYDMGDSAVHAGGLQALNAANLVELFGDNDYVPPSGMSSTYSDSTFNRRLKRAAQLIKMGLGIKALTVQLENWDTHESQGVTNGWFWDRVGDLSRGLGAFYDDMANSGGDFVNRVTVVVMSEFGRKLHQNNDGGFDHGHGGAMLLLGGAVNGGLHGTWPGLHHDALYQGQDLAVTTDYRRVLTEVLIRRMGNPNVGQVFPGYANYQPLGVVQGIDLEPIYDMRTPTAVDLSQTQAAPIANKAITAAGVGIAATASLVALRNRGS